FVSKMLVGYSSSSEEENDAVTEATDNVKSPTDDCGRTVSCRLPLPGCLLTMFPEEQDPQTEDRSLHDGRVRSFKHERGNWATYVYFAVHILHNFLFVKITIHLSVSQTVVLRHHWIQPFTQSLRTSLAHCKSFSCSAERLKVYCNAERTRTFLGMEVRSGQAQLLDLVKIVDKRMTEFLLETFYKDPSFHVSLAWCVGDMTTLMNKCINDLQRVVDDGEEGPFLLRLDCSEVRCKTGNKIFRFPLKP
uniref:U6 snRNA phosphodiesterase n=1 Tax=Tetraodon nigroviridis TaxID=99883 RepID=H3C6I2_TETNG